MSVHVSVYDQSLNLLGRVEHLGSVKREYALGRVGSCDLQIAIDDWTASEDVLASVRRYGNWILIDSDEGPPPWMGYVTGVSGSRLGQVITVRCSDIAGKLDQALTPFRQYEEPAGVIAKTAVEESTARFISRLWSGDIWSGGAAIRRSTSGQSVLSLLDDLQRASGSTWSLSIDQKGLKGFVNWHEPIHIVDRSYVLLTDGPGGAITDSDWDIDYSQVADNIIAIGDATGDNRPSLYLKSGLTATLGESKTKEASPSNNSDVQTGWHGQLRVVDLRTTDAATLEAGATAFLRWHLAPWRSLQLNLGKHAVWKEILLGGVYRAKFGGYLNGDFNGLVRIVSYTADENAGLMELACQVWELY